MHACTQQGGFPSTHHGLAAGLAVDIQEELGHGQVPRGIDRGRRIRVLAHEGQGVLADESLHVAGLAAALVDALLAAQESHDGLAARRDAVLLLERFAGGAAERELVAQARGDETEARLQLRHLALVDEGNNGVLHRGVAVHQRLQLRVGGDGSRRRSHLLLHVGHDAVGLARTVVVRRLAVAEHFESCGEGENAQGGETTRG